MSIESYVVEHEVTSKDKNGKSETKMVKHEYVRATAEHTRKTNEQYVKMGLVKEFVTLPNGKRGYVWSKPSDLPKNSEEAKRRLEESLRGARA